MSTPAVPPVNSIRPEIDLRMARNDGEPPVKMIVFLEETGDRSREQEVYSNFGRSKPAQES